MPLYLIAISVNLPDPEDLTEVLKHIDPPHIPLFAGEVRIVTPDDYRLAIRLMDVIE